MKTVTRLELEPKEYLVDSNATYLAVTEHPDARLSEQIHELCFGRYGEHGSLFVSIGPVLKQALIDIVSRPYQDEIYDLKQARLRDKDELSALAGRAKAFWSRPWYARAWAAIRGDQ